MTGSTDVARVEEILNPLTGELVPATDMPKEESKRQGTKTLALGAVRLEVSADSEVEWDVDELGKLRDLGLPEERFSQLVVETVSYKVDGRVAKQIEGSNEAYAAVIARARGRVPKKQYVSFKS